MSNFGVNFSRKRRGFRTWNQYHRIEGISKRGQSYGVFFTSLIFRPEIYVQFCGQRFLETGEVSGPGTNSIQQRGSVRVANHEGVISLVNFHAVNLCTIIWSTFFRNRRGFRTWDQFHRIQGTCEGGQSHRIFFLSLIFMLEIYVQFCGQRFLEAGEVSGPGTNSIESRGPVRVAITWDFLSIANFHAGNLCPIFSKQARF